MLASQTKDRRWRENRIPKGGNAEYITFEISKGKGGQNIDVTCCSVWIFSGITYCVR